MKIIRKLKKYRRSKLFDANVKEQSWFILRWEVLLIILLTFLVVFLNFLPHLIGDESEILLNNGDRYVPNQLKNSLFYSTFSIVLTIFIAIIVGVFTELGRFAGKYASSIFALVPSLVWLLSERNNSHISNIINTSNMLANFTFWTIVFIFSAFIFTWLLKVFFGSYNFSKRTRSIIQVIYAIFVRVIIIAINLLMILVMGFGLVNYGVFTLSLGSDFATMHHFDVFTIKNLNYDFHSESIITFITCVALLFALIIVSIGLSNIFWSEKVVAVYESDANNDQDLISVDQMIDEQLDSWHSKSEKMERKKRWWQND